MAKGGAAVLAGGGRVLVTHRAALGRGVRRKQRKKRRTACTYQQSAENASPHRKLPSTSSILEFDPVHVCAPASKSMNKKTQSAFMECQ